MAVDNKQIATDVLELVGGAENVTVATNCMTRLRLTLKDNNKADVEKIKKVKGVLGCQFAGSQLQVIIGQNVPKVLAEFVAISGVKQGEAVNENLDAPKEKFELKNLPNIILDYLSGSMTQLIPLLMAGGLFRTIAAVLGPTMLGVLSADDPTYTFLYTTLYEATFTFIPIYLGYAAAKKLGASPVLGMLLGGALMAPSTSGMIPPSYTIWPISTRRRSPFPSPSSSLHRSATRSATSSPTPSLVLLTLAVSVS